MFECHTQLHDFREQWVLVDRYTVTDESGENRIWLAAAITLERFKKTVGGNH